MECSHAVLTLMLLVPCEQSGGEAPDAVIADELRTPPVVQARPHPDSLQPAETHVPATPGAVALPIAEAQPPAESLERADTGIRSVTN